MHSERWSLLIHCWVRPPWMRPWPSSCCGGRCIGCAQIVIILNWFKPDLIYLADNTVRDSPNTTQSTMLYVYWHPPARSWSLRGLEYPFLVVFVSTMLPSFLLNWNYVGPQLADFRSPTGLYARLEGFELDDPQQMFDIDYFKMNPEVF